MKLKEVMQALCDGKTILKHGYSYKISENKFRMWDDIDKKWTDCSTAIEDLATMVSKISDTDPEAEYKKTLKPKYGVLGFDSDYLALQAQHPICCHFDKVKYNFISNNKKYVAFNDALKTLIELKAHPLSVAPVDGIIQYSIGYTGEIICTTYSNKLLNKLCGVSPSFDSEGDAVKASKDIGEDRIISMFKVLQGVYDE